jgi:TrmH family RNA methyltransferase
VALVEGPVLVAEALADASTRARIREIYTESVLDPASSQFAAAAGIPVCAVAPGGLDRVLDTVTPQPVVAVVTSVSAPLDRLGSDRPVVMLVDVRDPGNLGTLIRTAEAAGCAGLVLAGSCVDASNPKVVRAAAGAWMRSTIVEIADPLLAIEQLRATGRRVVATALRPSAVSLYDTDLRSAAVVLGNEAHGLSDDVIDAADSVMIIDFDGPTESLNVAVAGAVCVFEALRQRRFGGRVQQFDGRP